MATVAIVPTQLSADTGVVITPGAGTAIVAANAGQGTVSYAVGNTIEHLIVVGNSAQLKDADGNISITYATNSAGYVRAFYLP